MRPDEACVVGGWLPWILVRSNQILEGNVVRGSFSADDWDWCLTIEPDPAYAELVAPPGFPAPPGTCNAEGYIEVEVEPIPMLENQFLRDQAAFDRFWGVIRDKQARVRVVGPWVEDTGHGTVVNGKRLFQVKNP